jgi:hypothetical protein
MVDCQLFDSNEVATLGLTLFNFGAQDDTIQVSAYPSNPEWQTNLQTTEVLVGTGSSENVELSLRAPTSPVSEMLNVVKIVARSTGDPLKSDSAIIVGAMDSAPYVDAIVELESKEGDLVHFDASVAYDPGILSHCYFENFNHGLDSWATLSGLSSNQPGNLDGTGDALFNLTSSGVTDGVAMYSKASSLDWSLYDFELGINMGLSGSSAEEVSLYFYCQSNQSVDDCYGILLNAVSDTVAFFIHRNGSMIILDNASHQLSLDYTYKVRVSASHFGFRVFINATEVFSVSDDTFDRGTVALGVKPTPALSGSAIGQNTLINC